MSASADDADPATPDHAAASVPVGERLSALRIIDANLNRAAEGLRVVEEYCRFHLNDVHLSERCKAMRHALAAAAQSLDAAELAASRFTLTDVGAQIDLASEGRRGSLQDVAAASWQRVEQALRAIEEYGKLYCESLSRAAKRLRYEGYVLAKACLSTADSLARLADARLYVLIEAGPTRGALERRVRDLVAAGVHAIQLRDKRLPDLELLVRARIVREATRGTTALFIMNDRPDLAVLSQADGVHVGQDELGVEEVRRIAGPALLVGVSTHDIAQARQAVLDGASYIGCGPTFPSGTKPFDRFPGPDFLRQVAAEIALPAFAIGGIHRDNLSQVLAAGIARIAIGGAIATADDPAAEARRFLDALLQHNAVNDGIARTAQSA